MFFASVDEKQVLLWAPSWEDNGGQTTVEVFHGDHYQPQKQAQPGPHLQMCFKLGPPCRERNSSLAPRFSYRSRCSPGLTILEGAVTCRLLGFLSLEHCPVWLAFCSGLGLPEKQIASSVIFCPLNLFLVGVSGVRAPGCHIFIWK